MARCLVGCGSNLGHRRDQLDRAVELLRFMPGVSLRAVSRYRETRPVGGPTGQPAYLNGACLLDTDLGPHELLEALMAVEHTLLRDRTERWASRTIDLDLLLYDDLVMESVALTLPHPRMTTRRFVLEPCVEIAGGLSHPVAGCTLGDLLDNISVPHPLVAIVGAPGSCVAEIAAAAADATLAQLLAAPLAQPIEATLDAWRATAAAWARPLAAASWNDVGHLTIADFWLDSLPLAATAHLDRTAVAALASDVERIAAHTVAPNVLILLVTDGAVLEERLSGRSGGPGGTAICDPPAARVAAASAVQEQLVRRLHGRDEPLPRCPRAVVTVDATDLGRAAAEVAATVEAML